MLVTDGGTISPKEIAEVTERHPDSVRRALDRISDLVDREYGSVSLRSNYVAELVYEAVKEAKEATHRAVEAGAKALAAADRELDENTSALMAWAATQDIALDEQEDELRLRIGELDSENHHREIRRIFREGQQLWENAKRDPAIFRAGRYRYQIYCRSELLRLSRDKTRYDEGRGQSSRPHKESSPRATRGRD